MPGKAENCTRFSKTSSLFAAARVPLCCCCCNCFCSFFLVNYVLKYALASLCFSLCLYFISVSLFLQLICTLHLKTLCNKLKLKLNTQLRRRRRSRRQRDEDSCASSPFRAKTVELCAPRPRKKTLPKPTKTRNRFE